MGVSHLRSALHDRPSRGGRPALRAVVVAALVAAAVGLTGCAPGPAPKPTPTPVFTSEADAFKAAEQVYRDYVDALGLHNDGDSAADPNRFLGGAALEHSIEAERKRKADGLVLVGHTTVESFRGTNAAIDSSSATVVAEVCIDASQSSVQDRAGKDVTPEGRAPRALLKVGFAQSKGGLLIVSSDFESSQC